MGKIKFTVKWTPVVFDFGGKSVKEAINVFYFSKVT